MERHPLAQHTRAPEARVRTWQHQPFQPLTLRGDHGEVACRYYALPGTRAAALWVGTTGDWDTPARALYPGLCEALQEEGVASLRIRLRRPKDAARCVADIRAGIHYLAGQGIVRLALVGHGQGAAAVIGAAVGLRAACTVVVLAPQGDGTLARSVARLGPRCSLLLLQGTNDPGAPSSAARALYEAAREPKDFVLYPGAGHALDEVAEAVRGTVHDWIADELHA